MLRRSLFILAAALIPVAAQAQAKQCIVNWPWQLPTTAERTQQYLHKLGHTAGSALVTAAVAKATEDVRWGVAAGVAVGAIREIYKYEHKGMTCEVSSMAFDLAGVALGAGVASRWLVVPTKGGAQVAYSTRF
jgi:hypothetical protein